MPRSCRRGCRFESVGCGNNIDRAVLSRDAGKIDKAAGIVIGISRAFSQGNAEIISRTAIRRTIARTTVTEGVLLDRVDARRSSLARGGAQADGFDAVDVDVADIGAGGSSTRQTPHALQLH